MRLLVLGASGGCGRWVVRLATERGHAVTGLVREGTPFEPPAGASVARGDATDGIVLDRLLRGHDAVLCALGLRRAGRSPWAPLRSPPDLTERTMRALVPAMARSGVGRLVVISAAGVGESFNQLSRPVRLLVRVGNVGVAYRDLERMEAVLAASALDWLAVRPVTLLDGPPRRTARVVTRYALTSTVRRAEVAAWMLEAVESAAPFSRRRVMVAS